MFIYEIEFVLNTISVTKNICYGVYPSDKIPVYLKVGQSIIVNTDDSKKPGVHWVVIHRNDQNTIEIFDSFGRPTSELGENIANFACRWPEVIEKKKKIQDDDSQVCGAYSLLYVWYKSNGKSLNEIEKTFLAVENRDNRLQEFINNWRTEYNKHVKLYINEMLYGKIENMDMTMDNENMEYDNGTELNSEDIYMDID